MSERKVLNKYYPPDFDPAKIPRMKLAKNRQYTVRLMAPFNMRCVTCGEYIYKGKKFNARKEDVEDQTYLGIRIYRFYIKCTRCLQEISFKTDPRNTDYEIEAGATRNFMALKLAEEQAKKEEEELREEEANNPMKLLENRTQQSRNEIELLESLEELKDLNRRQQSVDYETMLRQYNLETEQEREERLKQLDEEYIKTVQFKGAPKNVNQIKRIAEEEIIEIDEKDIKSSNYGFKKETTLLKSESLKHQEESSDVKNIKNETNEKIIKLETKIPLKSKDISIGGFTTNKVMLKNLIKKKVTTEITQLKPSPPPPPPPPPSTISSSITETSTKQNTNIKNNGNALTMLSGYDDDDDDDDSSE